MTGLDTNVLVRFLVQDDPAQGALAHAALAGLTEKAPGFVGQIVMVELAWVLERAYGFTRLQIAQALEGFLEAHELVVETADIMGLALDRYAKGGPGFADHLIVAAAERAGCTSILTFDRKMATLPLAEALGGHGA